GFVCHSEYSFSPDWACKTSHRRYLGNIADPGKTFSHKRAALRIVVQDTLPYAPYYVRTEPLQTPPSPDPDLQPTFRSRLVRRHGHPRPNARQYRPRSCVCLCANPSDNDFGRTCTARI